MYNLKPYNLTGSTNVFPSIRSYMCYETLPITHITTISYRDKDLTIHCSINVSECNLSCMVPSTNIGEQYDTLDMEKKTTSPEYDDDRSTSKLGTTSEVNSGTLSNLATIAALGALVGLLLVLLAIVTTLPIWSCWLRKKKGECSKNIK